MKELGGISMSDKKKCFGRPLTKKEARQLHLDSTDIRRYFTSNGRIGKLPTWCHYLTVWRLGGRSSIGFGNTRLWMLRAVTYENAKNEGLNDAAIHSSTGYRRVR